MTSAQTFDLLLTGASLLDVDGVTVVNQAIGIRQAKIAYLGPNDPSIRGVHELDLAGSYAAPGLVDLHTHIFRGNSFWGIDHRRVSWRSGVTTWVDAGSSGAYNARGFRELVSADTPFGSVLAWLNISGIGLVGETFESTHIEHCDVEAAAQILAENRDFYIGLKVRIDHNTVGSNGLEPLRRGIQVADQLDVPLMVHIGVGPPSLDEVVESMRPGDVLTHCYTSTDMSPVDQNGAVRPSVREAVERGVRLDVGHGAGGFSFRTAEVMLAAGLTPTAISSDLHQLSAHGPMVGLITCMNKMLCLGMSLSDVVRAATSAPAELVGVGAGALAIGAPADLAILAIDEGKFELFDVLLESRIAQRRLRCIATIVGGRVLPPALPEPPVPWVTVPAAELDAYRELRESLISHRTVDAADRKRFAVPDLLDWAAHE